MSKTISGIHHVTAIASDPQQNVDFYTGVLGLRLVKVTINYDDPGAYHFYYGDEAGSPGTILTFFAWPGGRRGRQGIGEATVTAFSVPAGSLGYWRQRMDEHHVRWEQPAARWGAEILAFEDRDGLRLELVEDADAAEKPAWQAGPVPADAAIRGMHSVSLALRDPVRTAGLLTERMGFTALGSEGMRSRYGVGEHGIGRRVELVHSPEGRPGAVGVGSIHHVAWRTPDDAQQRAWLSALQEERYQVSPVMDRQYFHSIYFREPGGVLFEIATDPPGFTADETLAQLGSSLRLPEWLESHRDQIQAILPPLRLPSAGRIGRPQASGTDVKEGQEV